MNKEIIEMLEEYKIKLENLMDKKRLEIVLNVDKFSEKNTIKRINKINKILFQLREE